MGTQRILRLGLTLLTGVAVGWLALDALAPLALAQGKEAPSKGAPKKLPDKKVPDKVVFELRAKPWNSVFEWLTEQTGIPFISTIQPPTGTVNFIAKKGQDFTFPQIIDILNDALLAHKYVLLRRDTSFTLVPADEKIDPALVPRITLKDLEERGDTEIVSLTFPLTTLQAYEFAPEVKKMMGPFGEVVALERFNSLVMQDTAGNLRRIIQIVNENDEAEKSGLHAETLSHKCTYIRARDAEAILRNILGDPKELVQFKSGGGGPQGGPPGGPGSGDRKDDRARPTTKIRAHFITSDDRTNTVMVNGPADKISQAKIVLAKIDVPSYKGQLPVIVGPPILQIYPVTAGNAEVMSKTLNEIFKGSATIRISAIGTNQIMVYASPEDQMDIAKRITDLRPPSAITELVPLTLLDAPRTVEILRAAYPDSKNNAPYLDVDLQRNAVIIKGSKDQVDDVKQFIKAIGESPAAQQGAMRIITLDKGSAATLAEALQRLLPQMRDNPVKIVLPGGDPTPAPVKKTPPVQEPTNEPRPKNSKLRVTPEQYISFQDDEKNTTEKKNGKKAKAGAPITITAFGNKLIVTSEDQEALGLVSELVRLLTQTQPGEGDFEVIRLKHSNAVEVARVLDEAFNGPKTQGSSRGGDRGGPGGGGPGGGGPGGFPIPGLSGGIPGILGSALGFGGQSQGGQRVERVRIVADTNTNSLLVKASPLDLLTIRNLLSKALDTGETDSEAVIKTFVIGPLKHANATDVATIVRDVYRESMNNNFRGIGQLQSPFGGGSSIFGGGGSSRTPGMNIDQFGNPKGVTLSLGVDDKTNSLIVAAPTSMFEDIKKLVEQLETAAADSKQLVKVVSVKGVDPDLVQQVIDSIQGKSTGRSSGSSFGSPSGSGSSSGSGVSSFSGFSGFSGFRSGGGFSGGGGSGFGGSSGRDRGRNRSMDPPGFAPPSFGPETRGPDFFEQRVMDDPQPILFDPHHEPAHFTIPKDAMPFLNHDGSGDRRVPLPANQNPHNQNAQSGFREILLTGGQEKPGQEKPKPPPFVKEETVVAPRLPVIAEGLPQLGIIVLRANNPQDLEAALAIIKLIQDKALEAEIEVEIVLLKHADSTSVSNILNQLFARVVVGPNANTQITAPQRQQGGGGQQQGPGGFGQQGPGDQQQQQQQQQQQRPGGQTQAAQATSLVIMPLPRQNGILLAVPKGRKKDILKEIERLDVPMSTDGKAVAFPLKRASAQRVANLVNQFFADRYPNESRTQNQVRVTWDDSTNTVFVQAAPTDLAEIRGLIERIDSTVSNAVNDLRVIPLRNAVASELADLITRSIADTFLSTTSGLGGGQTGLGGFGQQGGQQGFGQQGFGQQGFGQQQGLGGQTGLGSFPRQTKVNSLRLLTAGKDGKLIEAGVLEDLRITADLRTNSLVISAPEKTMDLVLALVRELDMPPFAKAEINIFTLKKADAVQTALALQQLFLGARTGAGAAGGVPGGPGAAGLGQAAGAQAGQVRPLQITVSGLTPEGAPIIDLRITVDERTNSLIVAGSRNDLDVIEAVIAKLEDANVHQRRSEAIKLRNALAADVAAALNDFVTRSLAVFQKGNQLTSFQEIQRDVIITAEPISNTLLISATAPYFDEIMRLVSELDSLPPQVMIQVLVAEVDFNDSNEFGVEIGLQTPVLFRRGIIPAPGLLDVGSVSYSAATDGSVGLVPSGVSVTNTINPVGSPGFNFNTTNPLGNNVAVNPNVLGVQGIGNLGVGRISPSNNIGGFVFSAASDSVNLLVRALKVQGRIDVLSRPQIMTLDNQTALINVGQEIPIVTSSTLTATGLAQQNIDRRSVGVILQVTPKITPDGRVLMRVVPEVSSVVPTPVQLGNGNLGTALNIQHLETTVSAHDGETIALGGLITKRDAKTENKIPWLGDLPGVGALFRFRTQTKTKTELLIILTPHIVRSKEDAARIMAEETRKMDWMLCDVMKIHGAGPIDPLMMNAIPGPGPIETTPEPMKVDPLKVEPGPAPRPLPPAPKPEPQASAPSAAEAPHVVNSKPVVSTAVPEGPMLVPAPFPQTTAPPQLQPQAPAASSPIRPISGSSREEESEPRTSKGLTPPLPIISSTSNAIPVAAPAQGSVAPPPLLPSSNSTLTVPAKKLGVSAAARRGLANPPPEIAPGGQTPPPPAEPVQTRMLIPSQGMETRP